MPRFFGPNANPTPIPETNINAFGLGNVCSKPIVTAVQGICFTIGIEMNFMINASEYGRAYKLSRPSLEKVWADIEKEHWINYRNSRPLNQTSNAGTKKNKKIMFQQLCYRSRLCNLEASKNNGEKND